MSFDLASESDIHFLTSDEIHRLSNQYERQFAAMLVDRGYNVAYEPRQFTIDLDGIQKGTKPDFYVIDPHRDDVEGVYIEVTGSHGPGEKRHDHKKRQKEVMCRLNQRYRVYYREDLDRFLHLEPDVLDLELSCLFQ
jgi:hypothetical protein